MKFPIFIQYDKMDCGPTCLRMIAKHYKKNISLQYLRDKTQIGRDGVNLLGICDAAELIGFRAQAVQINYKSLVNHARLPAILHWNQNHFVVLHKIKKQSSLFRNKNTADHYFYIADPARGLITYSAEEFKSKWISSNSEEGIALLLEPSEILYKENDYSFKEEEGPIRKKTLTHYILPYKKLIIQLLVGLLVASLLQLFLPFLTQSVVDTGINTANIHFVYIVLLAQLALFAGRIAVEFVRSWILLHISTRINISILTDFLSKLMNLPVSFFDSKQTGDILQRMNDHRRIETFLTGTSLNTLFSLVNVLGLSIVLLFFNTTIFTIFLISSILYSLWVVLFLKKRKELDFKSFEVSAKEQSATIQMVQGMQEIKLNGLEKPIRWKWESLQAKIFKLKIRGLSLNQWQQVGAFFINEGKNIIITFFSAKAVIDGDMTLGSMLAIQYIIGQLNSPIEQMVNFLQSWQNAKISLDRINEIHNLDDEEPLNKEFNYQLPPAFARNIVGGHTSLELIPTEGFPIISSSNDFFDSETFAKEEQIVGTGSIHFDNVSFSYPGAGSDPVLKNINFSIPSGKITAIVGTSGSGKTTLIKLLLKFYEPHTGDIKLSGTSLKTISHKFFRSRCGVVMQESLIFSETIAKNIAAGADRVDMERLYNAASVANIGDFIDSFPMGFNTKIGPEGINLSMGQKQRILLARAVYRNPDFLFLDEATNSLDASNESIILHNLKSYFKGRTVVVVAHRLSTVKNADQIIVLKKGEIIEKGSHSALVSIKGEYYDLIKNQLDLEI